jgi:hypothetical protein
MNEHKTVRAVFAATWPVSSPADSGTGSLRAALAAAQDGDVIALQGQTITLATPLAYLTKSLEIQGNGAILTQTGFTEAGDSQLLRVAAAAEVRISRLHFKGGRALTTGGAINNAGKLILESCIFSDNRTTNASGNGGAVYTTGANAALTFSGCTFYGNAGGTSSGFGGAVYKASGALTLTGNIFWGNTASGFSELYVSGTTSSGGFNITDKASGTGATAAGWTFVAGDVTLTDLSFDENHKPSSGSSLPVMPSPLAGVPATYFNGDPRGSTPGAMPE